MIDFLSMTKDNIVGFRVKGRVGAGDVERLTRVIEAKLQRLGEVSVYVEIERIEGISLAAIVKDLKFGLRHLRDIEKEAIVAHGKWMGEAVALIGRIFPSAEVRHFSFEEKQKALDWIVS